MTCMAMFGNDVRTGMKNILQLLQLIRKGLHWALAGCTAAAAGTTTPLLPFSVSLQLFAGLPRLRPGLSPFQDGFLVFGFLPFGKKAEAFTRFVRSVAAQNLVNNRSCRVSPLIPTLQRGNEGITSTGLVVSTSLAGRVAIFRSFNQIIQNACQDEPV